MSLEPFFLPATSGQRFCLFHGVSVEAARGAFLYLHPFAEEMNCARRMAALQARALAQHGYAVLQIDLHGCGDSSGDFGDASWETWIEDALLAYGWLRGRINGPIWLWGLRAGCLLAVDAATRLEESINFLFWQPVVSGTQQLRQFLRMKLAADLAGKGIAAEMEKLHRDLARGNLVEVAGYQLAPELASGLEQAELLPARNVGRMLWLELSSGDTPTMRAISQKYLDAWKAVGFGVSARVLSGPMFWQSPQAEECPALMDATLQLLSNEALG